MADGKKFLFITGCARSGTTALRKLMGSHEEIAMGTERYNKLTKSAEGLTPALFEKERFFDLRPDDTGYDNLQEFSRSYARMEPRYDRATYWGDKQPGLYRSYPMIEKNFPDATILYILRNVIDVANSYARNGEYGSKQMWNVEKAVADWQVSVKRTLEFLNSDTRKTKIVVVAYEELFMQRSDIAPLFGALGLDYTTEVKDGYTAASKKSDTLDELRGDVLTRMQRYYIALNAPFGTYRALHDQRVPLSEVAIEKVA